MVSFAQRLEAKRGELSPAALRVAEFLVSHPDRAAVASATEIADSVQTSDATVVRTVKMLGYSGLPDLRRGIGEEWAMRQNPREALRERVAAIGADERSVLDALIEDAIAILEETRLTAGDAQVRKATEILSGANRIVVMGFGRAGSLAEYMSLGLNRIGRQATAATTPGFRLADQLASLGTTDAILLLAPLRHVHEIDVALAHAEMVGASSILVSEALGEKLRGHVTCVLETGSSQHRLANETIAPMAIIDALLLGVASVDPDVSLASWSAINDLRSALGLPGHQDHTGPGLPDQSPG